MNVRFREDVTVQLGDQEEGSNRILNLRSFTFLKGKTYEARYSHTSSSNPPMNTMFHRFYAVSVPETFYWCPLDVKDLEILQDEIQLH